MPQSLIDIIPEYLKPLSDAEKKLFLSIEKGEFADFRTSNEEADKPENSDKWGDTRTLRAKIIIWLSTDGEAVKKVPFLGVQIRGAKILGMIGFNFATLPHPLGLFSCVIDDGITLMYASTRSLNFKGSRTGAILANGLETKGSVFLNDKFYAKGEVRLPGADIGGNLECSNGTFENEAGYALNADRLRVKGYVFLTDGFKAKGEVKFLGADIGGDLACRNGTFENKNGNAFCAERMKVAGIFMWTTKERPVGGIDLLYASVGQLVDNKESWPENGKLQIDGFEYKALAGNDTPKSAKHRLEWLRLQLDKPFKPQPYEQLAKVLRGMGHEKDALEVLIEKNRDLRKHGDIGRWGKVGNIIWDKTIGYGWKPWKVFLFIVPLLVFGVFTFWCADKYLNVIQPSKERVFMDKDFKEKGIIPSTYPIFNPFVYSLDTFVPFVDLHQESYWLPDASKEYGSYFRLYLWFHIVLGWVFSTLAALGFSGLVRKE